MAKQKLGIKRAAQRAMSACWLFAGSVGAMTAFSQSAHAQVGSSRYSSIIVDANTGAVLSSASPDALRHPASLTKMMTLYMLFEALRDHRVTLDQPVPISAHAASMQPTKLGLPPGSYITVEQAILALVTLSANDAASALGELLGGDEERFAQMMTLRAHALGMSRTTFENASGLPDPDQVTTARDIALLAKHLIKDFPNEYRYFSTPNFVFRGRTIWNHDHMLQTYEGADGLKTGYTLASGHNLATSAVRDDKRLIGVVLGAASNGERDQHMAALLDHGFVEEGVSVVAYHHDVPWHTSLMSVAHAEPAPYTPRPSRHAVAMRNVDVIAPAHGHHRHRMLSDSGRHHGRVTEVAEAPSGHSHHHKPKHRHH